MRSRQLENALPRAIAALGMVLAAGCVTVGAGTISCDRFDYAAAISESWKNQMLLNLVKVRYADVPVFLDIASAINSYSIESGASASLELPIPLAGSSDAFVVIRYRDHWFWIEDRDLASKGVFSFLMFLLSLTETGGGQVAPVITVPAG